MRVAIIAESFLPAVNGVSNSILHIIRHRGEHELLVIAPGRGPLTVEGVPIHRVPKLAIKPYPIGLPLGLIRVLRKFQPEVIHLASPFVLGAAGAFAAHRLKVPVVAVFQTDIAGFATRYRLGLLEKSAWRWLRIIHNACDMTLAPSTPVIETLQQHGFSNVHHWGRGVDTELFHPNKRTSSTGIGYVGRLAPEKGLHRLTGIPVTIIGAGPQRTELERTLPDATFLGELRGEALAQALANFDVFIHPGEFETFCQTIQEAHASGVPVISINAGGPKDLITPDTGMLIDACNFAAELPAAIDYVLQHREEMGAAARLAVEERTWETVVAELFRLYKAVVKTGYVGYEGQVWR